MAAPMRRVIPWFGKEDWSLVYEELFQADPVLQRHALDRIAVWKCRISHRLSAGIDCTWHLVAADLQYKDAERCGDLRKLDQSLRLAFSMALVRFVNHLTEKKQTRSYAQPVHTIAEELGLPEWLVEMRHEATHTNMPALPVLRAAAQCALAWIKRQYWDAMASEDVSGDELTQSLRTSSDEQYVEDLADSLVAFTKDQYHFLQDQAQGGARKNNKLDHALKNIAVLIKKCREKAVSLVADDGYLLPSQEQLSALDIHCEELLVTEELDLPSAVLSLWTPILKLFQQEKLFPLLLQKLVTHSSTEANPLQQRMCAGWTCAILRICGHISGRKQNVHLNLSDLQSLLKLCLLNPSVYTSRLIHKFVGVGAVLSPHQQSQLETLLRCYHGKLNNLHCQVDVNGTSFQPEKGTKEEPTRMDISEIHRVEDIIQQEPTRMNTDISEIHRVEDIIQQRVAGSGVDSHSSTDASPWTLAEDVVGWASYPLGACPNVNLSYTSLELDRCVDTLPGSGTQLRTRSLENQEITDVTGTLSSERGGFTILPDAFQDPAQTKSEWNPGSLRHQLELF